MTARARTAAPPPVRTAAPPPDRTAAPPPDDAGHRTEPQVPFDAQREGSSAAGHLAAPGVPIDAQLAALAPGRDGIFTLAELAELGLGRRAVGKRAAAGRLHRVHHAVYSVVPPELLTVRGRYRAATLACSGSRHAAALSHRSAADLHGLRECHRRVVEVVVPGRTTHRHPGIQVHRSIHLADSGADLTVVDGIRVTTVARTLLDLAAVVPARALERALDRAEQLRVHDECALNDQLLRNPRHPGAGRLRTVLDRYRIGAAITDSELEETFLAFCRDHGLPTPEVRAAIDPGDGAGLLQPDAVWRDQRVIVELDGERVHRTHRAFHVDRVRDQRLLSAGWRVVRVTWHQLTKRPHELAAILWRILGRAA
jgi:predicted transcriptional regulator of viral defense system